jgi:hypothetical protein
LDASLREAREVRGARADHCFCGLAFLRIWDIWVVIGTNHLAMLPEITGAPIVMNCRSLGPVCWGEFTELL